MNNFLVSKTTAVLYPYLGCEPGTIVYDKLNYGVELFYINLVKSIFLIAVASVLGVVHYVLVVMLAHGFLRTYSFGLHLQRTVSCTALGMIYYLGSVYISIYTVIPIPVKIVILLVCTACFALYAPSQTKKRPIPLKQQKPLKKKSLISLAIVSFIVIALSQFPVYSNLVLMAAVCQVINILPITYRICKA